MAQIGITISQEQVNNLLKQVQDIIKTIEDKSIVLNIDDKELESKLTNIKNTISELSKENTIKFNAEGIEKLQEQLKGTFTSIDKIKEQLASLSNVIVKVKMDDSQAIATIKNLEGQMAQIRFEGNLNAKTGLTEYSLDENQPIKSITDNSQAVKQKQLENEDIKNQNQLYKETTKLLKEKYQLINAINDAEKNG